MWMEWHNRTGSYNSLPDKENVIFISMAQSQPICSLERHKLRSERSEIPDSRIDDFFYAIVLIRLLFFDHFFGVQLIYSIVVVSPVQQRNQPHIYIMSLCFRFLTHYREELCEPHSRSPLVVCSHTQQSAYVGPVCQSATCFSVHSPHPLPATTSLPSTSVTLPLLCKQSLVILLQSLITAQFKQPATYKWYTHGYT